MTIGDYPAVTLEQARRSRGAYLAGLAQGITPKPAKDAAEEGKVSAVVARWLSVRGGGKKGTGNHAV